MRFGIFAFIVSLLYLVTSCDSNRCKTIVCQNGGICDYGECVCLTGYYGDLCEITWIAKFIGNYNGVDNCSARSFSSKFNQQSHKEGQISNFANSGQELILELNSAYSLSFDKQLLGADQYSGTGVMQDDTILLINYTALKNFDTPTEYQETCILSYIKF